MPRPQAPAPRPGQLFDVRCSALDGDGSGVAEVASGGETLRVHIAGALPGEDVRAHLEHRSTHCRAGVRDAWASLREIVSRSPQRTDVACPAYGACGGCALMALDYPAQLSWKAAKVRDELAAHPTLTTVPVEPCAPSPRLFGYRNQAKYIYGRERGSSRLVLGAFAPRSHALVDLAGCRVVEPVLDDVRAALLAVLADFSVEPFDEIHRTGVLRYCVLRSTAPGEVMATLVVGRRGWVDAAAIAAALRKRAAAVVSVILNVNVGVGNALFGTDESVLSGAPFVEDAVADVRVRLSSRAFFQTNRDVASAIYRAIVCDVRDGIARAVDAYAGAGGIALSVAAKAHEVIAIEENAAATATAADFLAQESHGRIRTLTGDAGDCLAAIPDAEVIVLNPPRKGCDERVLAAVSKLRPAVLVYLSCNPHTLARDLVVLARAGAQVARVRPFDMMPHTPHVETLVRAGFV